MPLSPDTVAAVAGSLFNSLVVTGAFIHMAHAANKREQAHSDERRTLTNAALSGTTMEFVARQRATEAPAAPVTSRPHAVNQIDL